MLKINRHNVKDVLLYRWRSRMHLGICHDHVLNSQLIVVGFTKVPMKMLVHKQMDFNLCTLSSVYLSILLFIFASNTYYQIEGFYNPYRVFFYVRFLVISFSRPSPFKLFSTFSEPLMSFQLHQKFIEAAKYDSYASRLGEVIIIFSSEATI